MRTSDDLDTRIDKFLASPAIAVAGASDNPAKYGHKVFRCLLQNRRTAYAINPNVDEVLGHKTYPSLAAAPDDAQSLSIITPPAVTERVVDEAIARGVKSIWMQPGAESSQAIDKALDAGVNVISGGPCLLVVLGYRESA